MTCTVTISKAQVLCSVHEFLEEAEHIGLETVCDDRISRAGLTELKKYCLTGAWENVIECIQLFRDSEGCKNCLYEATKQCYLEELSTKPPSQRNIKKSNKMNVHLLKDLLAKLKELCPSREDYSSLQSLTKLATVNDSSDYANWSVGSSRLQVYCKIARWMSRECNIETKPDQSKSVVDMTLVRLLAKGLLYEKCEQICLKRCHEEKSSDGSQMFDLCGWMQHQPDSAYQISPTRCQLAFSTTTATLTPPLESTVAIEPPTRAVCKDVTISKLTSVLPKSAPTASEAEVSILQSIAQPTIAQHTIAKKVERPISKQQSVAQPTAEKLEGPITEKIEQASSSKAPIELTPDIIEEELRPSEPESTTTHTIEETASDVIISGPQARSSILIRESSNVHKIRVFEEFEDNFVHLTPTHKLLPQLRSGRNSSTPKPSSNKLPPSPQTSPVTCTTPQREVEPRGRAENNRTMSIPRRFDFVETSNEASIEWPTANLLCQIQDTQAVRSVAFSQTGCVVAVGANSRTLRLCSTEPLLEKKTSDDDLPVFYHHPSYHKGSIYCLAWSGDTLLASGSNDHTIRLLSYDPANSNSPCKTLGTLNIHTGTVRDLVFMPSGLLVSGGAVDSDVKLCDPDTKQVVCSLVGHSEQVLALDVIDSNLVASSSQDKTIKLWDVRRETPVWTIDSTHPVNALSVCPLRNELVSSQADGSCCIHSLTGGKTRVTLHPHADDCRSVQWSPSRGQWVLSGSYDGTVCLTEPGSTEWQPVCEHSSKVIQVKWHCEGEVFATTSADKRVCFWNLS